MITLKRREKRARKNKPMQAPKVEEIVVGVQDVNHKFAMPSLGEISSQLGGGYGEGERGGAYSVEKAVIMLIAVVELSIPMSAVGRQSRESIAGRGGGTDSWWTCPLSRVRVP